MAVIPAAAQEKTDTSPREFDSITAVYAEQLARIETKRDTELDEACNGHITALQELENRYQSAGELKPLLAVRKERTRFAASPALTDITVASSPEGLATLQKQYVETCKDIRLTSARSIVELSQHYGRRLVLLQKELTKKGLIDQALAIMTEVDNLATSPEVAAAKTQIESGGTSPVAVSTRTSRQTTGGVDIDALGTFFHGKIVRWNPVTHEITCKYDFRNENQLAVWDGAGIDELRERMVCDGKETWFSPRFASVSRIEYDAYLYSGSGPVRVILGKALYADLEPGANGKALLHQGNPAYPLVKSHGGAQTYMRYTGVLTLENGAAAWVIGSRSFRKERLRTPITVPVGIGFGHTDCKVMFDNITITGMLGPDVLNAVAAHQSVQ